jgi:signal transduction histidine kinase
LKKTQRVFLLFSAIYFGFILSLGAWWLHLIVKYGEQVDALGGQVNGPSVAKMVKWEGATFFTVLILLSFSFVMLYLKDQKKTKGLQAFFASMTHELKTPLASIRLQAEVLHENIEEHENKILQLSRLEGGGEINLIELDLKNELQQTLTRWSTHQEVSLVDFGTQIIRGDSFALELILRNLLENTKSHAGSSPATITVDIDQDPQFIIVNYTDGGSFEGELKKLTNIFYRHNSHKGSGIGLYLIKRLMNKMSGELKVSLNPDSSLNFALFFPRVKK